MGKQLKPWAVALGCLLALAACTEPSASPQTVGPVTASPVVSTSKESVSTTIITPASTPESSTAAPSEVASAVTTETVTTQHQTTVSVTIPQAMTSEEQMVAGAATANFAQAIQISDSALSDPNEKDWTNELSRYWAGAALNNELASISGFRENGWHAIGIRTVRGVVSNVSEFAVIVQACVDDSTFDILDMEGISRISRGEGHPRIAIYRVTNFAAQGWLVDNLEVPDPVQTC